MPLKENGFIGTEIQSWIEKCRERHASFFNLANEVNRFCHARLFAVDLRNRPFHEVLVLTICLRVLSNYQAAMLLCERGMMSEAMVMARAMIESVFMVCAVARDEQLARDYVNEDQKGRLRFLNKLRSLHGSLPPKVNDQDIGQLENTIKIEIKTVGIRERSTEEWAKEAGMHSWYLTVYAALSTAVHAKVRDLERYLVEDNEGNLNGLQWGPDDSELKHLITCAIEGMLVALKSTLSCLGQQQDEVIGALLEKLRKVAEPDESPSTNG